MCQIKASARNQETQRRREGKSKDEGGRKVRTEGQEREWEAERRRGEQRGMKKKRVEHHEGE